jgi:hypothetical protein
LFWRFPKLLNIEISDKSSSPKPPLTIAVLWHVKQLTTPLRKRSKMPKTVRFDRNGHVVVLVKEVEQPDLVVA